MLEAKAKSLHLHSRWFIVSLSFVRSTHLSGQIKEKIINLDKGDGVIVFTDLISASPYTQSQIAISKLENNEKISLIGNLNFQMLIQAINGQVLEENIDQVVKNILEITKQEVLEWKYEKIQIENPDEDDDF